MGEASIRAAGISARTPDHKQAAAMEAQACLFADAILAVGMALDAPDKRLMTRLLTIRAASKVIARMSKLEGITPAQEVGNQMRFWPQAVEMAIRDEKMASLRIAVEMAKGGG